MISIKLWPLWSSMNRFKNFFTISLYQLKNH